MAAQEVFLPDPANVQCIIRFEKSLRLVTKKLRNKFYNFLRLPGELLTLHLVISSVSAENKQLKGT